MRVLLTGCNGLVACRLAKRLQTGGHGVFGTSLNAHANPYIIPERYAAADVRDAAAVGRLMDRFLPDVLVHAAAITKPDVCEADPGRCLAVNRDAVPGIFREAERRGIYGIHLSTDFVFAGNLDVYTEESEDFPAPNLYGTSKREAEQYLLEHYPQVAVVRTALVYGYEPLLPRNNVFTWAVDSLRKGMGIRVVDDQFRTPTSADDLARGLAALCESRHAGMYHLAGADYINVYGFVRLVADVFGLDGTLVKPVPTAVLKEPARRALSTRLSIDKATRHLGYRPKPLRENLEILFGEYPPMG